jgi:hypothetical protein
MNLAAAAAKQHDERLRLPGRNLQQQLFIRCGV